MDQLEKMIIDEALRDVKAQEGKLSTESMEKMYNMFVDYENYLHEKNLKRIRVGITCIWIIPAIFLVLMFVTQSSKLIFLVLWIVSLFSISVYLILIEYLDYNLQQRMNQIHGREDAEITSLLEVPEVVEERVLQAVERIDDSDLIEIDLEGKISQKKEVIQERIQEKKKKAEGGKENEEHN